MSIFPSISQSALISTDDHMYGAGALTLDSTTKLEWLDISITANRSYNDINSQLGIGGEFEGFRYATQSDIEQFWNNAGIFDFSNTYITNNYTPIKNLITLIGATTAPAGVFSIGLYDGLTLGGYQRTASIQFRDDLGLGKANLTLNGLSQDTNYSSHGSYLVRDAATVPEPSTLLLILTSFLMLGLHIYSPIFTRRLTTA
jgi:hypothetical protein